MAWNLNAGAVQALLGKAPSASASLLVNTISFGDGDGTGGTDTINDTGSGLGVFDKHDFILIVNPNGTNDNILVKAITQTAPKIEVIAGSFATEAVGTYLALVGISSGSLREIFKNGTIDIYSNARPATPDLTESGTKLVPITLDGGAFVPGTATNGLNLGAFSGNTIKRAVDPETGLTEVWRGAGLAAGTAGWCRWYANDKTTGASSSAIRMDGVVATSGGDLNMVNGTTVALGIYSEVSDVSWTMSTS